MGLSLKAGVTVNSLKFDHVASEIGSFSNRKVLPFLGAGYEFKNGLNLNLHGTIGKNDKLDVGSAGELSIEDKANISFLVGYRF